MSGKVKVKLNSFTYLQFFALKKCNYVKIAFP